MNKKKILLSALLGVGALALAFKVSAGKSSSLKTAPKRNLKGASFVEMDAYVEAQMRHLDIPGAVLAIVEGDRITHLRGFGKARSDGELPAPQTPFFIGSLTKSFTALAVMQLVERGRIDLDSPVQRYLPWFRVAEAEASAQMTVRHLLNQTSGLPMLLGMANLEDTEDRPDATERQVRGLSTLKLKRAVGSMFEYSNLNYNVLGLIVEAASGESYSAYIQKHVFDPLGMSHSYTSKTRAQKDGLAVGHCYWFGVPVATPNLHVPLSSLPAGQLISSAEDMAKYLIAHLNGGRYLNTKILSPGGIAQLHRGAAEIIEMGMKLGHYAMGWISEKKGESNIVSHSGIVPDFGGFMALVPEQKKGFVLLVNANHAMLKMTLDEVGMGAALLLAGEPPARTMFGGAPWLMRAQLLIPIIQIANVISSVRQLRRWRRDPDHRPQRGDIWGKHILIPLIPSLLVSMTLIPMLGKMRGFVKLFIPDFSWIARICGSFAAIWIFLRTGLVLRALRNIPRNR
jgi:CubicO group peptidase (beta-lactamase class C family)